MTYVLNYNKSSIQLLNNGIIVEEVLVTNQTKVSIYSECKNIITDLIAVVEGVYLALKHGASIFTMEGWPEKFGTVIENLFGKSFPLKFKYIDKDRDFWLSETYKVLQNSKSLNTLQKLENKIIFLFAGIQKIFIKNPDSININSEKFKISFLKYNKRQSLSHHLTDFNVFSDASVREKEKITTVATVVKDKNDNVLAVHREKLLYNEYYDNNKAEIYAIAKGLELAKVMGVDKVRIFTDSLCAIETLQKYSPYYKGQFSEGIEKIIKYCSNFELCEIIHIKRHHNATADSLTHF